MSIENGKEIDKKAQSRFLPCVKGETIRKVLLEGVFTTTSFTTNVLEEIEKNNSELHETLIEAAQTQPRPPLFLRGVTFTYQSLLQETKTVGIAPPHVEKQTIQTFQEEIKNSNEIFRKKEAEIIHELKQSLENLESNSEMFNSEGTPIVLNLLNDFDQKQKKLLDEREKSFDFLTPRPSFYHQENPALMEVIEKFSSGPQMDHIIRLAEFCFGAMLTYELLRHQAETDYLEKRLGLAKS